MIVWKKVGIFAVSLVSMASVACSGSDGATGPAGATGAAGAAGDKGDTGPAGTGTTPSVGVIVPNIGLLDRELDVTVTAEAVDFTAAAPTFDFGSGVKTSNIQVLSATTAYVHLTVDAAATTGARDVKVTAGSNNLTSKDGFKVAAPINLTITPALEQGQLAEIQADNLDLQHAFDPAGFTLSVTGIELEAFSTTATHADGLFLVDPNAPAKTDIVGGNVDSGFVTETYSGGSADIKAHAPTAVTPGTPLDSTLAAGVSNIHTYTSATAAIYEVSVAATGAKISPFLAFYTDSGVASGLADNSVLDQYFPGNVVYPELPNKKGWIVVGDLSGGGGAAADYGYTVNVVAHTGTIYAEPTTAHETLAHATTNAIVTALPAATTNNGVIIQGALGVAGESDWYEVTLAANDTLEASFNADFGGFEYEVVNATGDNILGGSFIAPAPSIGSSAYAVAIDQDFGTGDPLTAGKYYVHVTSVDATKGNYLISLRKQ